ncbi:hypothetical protein JKP88DRAFT_348407 [Tribonema minus]|uniref:J domain-containing protein n=1 Tax=Tribonema minus TaxID=303371 RepID=A0A835Z3J0_9STRA|nr:hypothetical protein JKP88DRAFT_348407 [Tribonema minus]
MATLGKDKPSEAQLAQDWYATLGVTKDATDEAIQKSYRKLALKCHPDKNPDKPEAAALFDTLTRTKDFLLDSETRREYDAKRQAAEARARLKEQRDKGMGERRRRMKAELEARERKLAAAAAAPGGAQRGGSGAKSVLDRLKEEGRARREAAAAAQAARDAAAASSGARKRPRSEAGAELEERQVRVKWSRRRCSHGDDTLAVLFGRYGSVTAVSLTGTKGNSALVTFATPEAASAAAAALSNDDTLRATRVRGGDRAIPSHDADGDSGGGGGSGSGGAERGCVDHKDYESVVMMRMRQAAERQRLIREMEHREGIAPSAGAAAAGDATDDAARAAVGSGGRAAAAGEGGGHGAAAAAAAAPSLDEGDVLARMMRAAGAPPAAAAAAAATVVDGGSSGGDSSELEIGSEGRPSDKDGNRSSTMAINPREPCPLFVNVLDSGVGVH